MAPTLVWLDSFHHRRDSTALTYTAQNPIYDTTGRVLGETTVAGRRAGSLALQLVEDGSTATNVTKSVTAGNRVLVESFYIRVTAKPSGDSTLWFATATVGALVAMRSATGFIYSRIAAGGVEQTGNVDCSDGAWHRIDTKFVTSANGYTLDVQVDGAALTQATVTSTAADITTGGLGATAAGNTLTCQYTDWVRSVTSGDYPIGAHKCVPLLPNADGTHNWTTTHFDNEAGNQSSSVTTLNTSVDDWLSGAADTTTYIGQNSGGVADTQYAEILLPDVPSGATVWAARAVAAIFAAGTASDSATTRIVDGSGTTVLDLYTGDQSDTAPRVQAAMVPSITSDTLLNALKFRVGFATDANPEPRWSALMIDYATLDGTTTNQAVAATTTATAVVTAVKKGIAAIAATSALAVGRVLNTGKVVASATTLTLGRALQTGKLVVSTVTGTIVLAKTKVSLAAIAATTTLTAVLAASKVIRQAVAAVVTFMADVFQGVSTGTQLFFRVGKPVAASTTVTASVLRSLIGKLIAATTTFTVAQVRKTTHTIAAAVILTVAIVTAKVKLQAVAATTALTAVISRNVGKLVSAATTLTAALTRRIGHTVAAATTLTVAVLRRVPQTIAATVTLTASLVRRVGKAIAASTAVTAVLSFLKVALKAIAASTTLTVTIPRKVGKLVTAATTVTAAITRRLTKLQAIAATTALAAVLARKVGKQVSGVITLGVALALRTGKLVAAGATLAVGLVRKVGKRIPATSTVTAVVSAVFRTATAQVIAVTSSLTISISRRSAKTVAAATTLTVAIGRAIGHVLTVAATAAFSVVVVRSVGKLLAVGVTVSAGMTRGITKTLEVLVDMGAALRRIGSNMAHGSGLVDPFEAEGEDALTADTDAATFDAETDDELLVDVTAGDGWDADTGEGW